MVRKSSIYFFIITILLLIPGHLLSLGLGEIEVDSALNQPLIAQINLIGTREDEFEEMRVELAPANVFDRVGVPRPYFLTQLKFQPVKLPNGGTAIQVTSKDPVREPFLTFLVEVTWPKGRLLREYTVLLDPPEFAQQLAPQIAAPVTTPEEPVVQAEPEVAVSQADEATSEEDLAALRERMDKELGIDGTEEITPVAEEVVPEEVPQEELVEEEVVVAEPTAEELEEAVEEAVEETVGETQVTVEAPSEDVAMAEEQDLETLRRKMDEALGIDGTEPIERMDPVADEVAEVESEEYVQSSSSDEVTVVSGDTLYNIAKSAAPSGVSVNQMMLAIQQANSDAFIKNNVNLLKKGAVLRIPESDQAQSISVADARSQISQQNALWKEYRSVVTQAPAANVDAPELVKETSDVAKEAKQALQETTKEPVEAKQDLNILASEEAKQAGATQVAGGEELEKLQNEVNLTKELAESRGKENEELKSRVEALESMLEKKEKILNIQNQQLKDLQEQLSSETDKAAAAEKLLKEKAAAEEAKPVVEPEVKPDPKPVVKEETSKPKVEPLPDFEDEPIVAEQQVSKPKLAPLPDWDSLPEIEETVPEQVAESKPEEKPAEVKPTETKPVEKPAEVSSSPDAETGIMATILGFVEPFKQYKSHLQIGTGALAVLLGGIWFWRRKQVKTVELSGLGEMPMDAIEDGEHFDDILDETIVTPQAAPQASVGDEDIGAMDDLGTAEEYNDAISSAAGDVEAGEDILDEADVYISYGLHQQAQDLLNDAIAKEPGRNDYKAKLAEVYYSQKDQQGFEQYAEKIKDDLNESSSEWQKIMSMGKELAPASALFAGAAAVATTTAVDKPEDTDVDIGLQTAINEPLSDANLEDTILENDAEKDDGGLDFNIDDVVTEQIEDDPVASKIMEANETSDILNFDVDDLANDSPDDTAAENNTDAELDAIATGIQEAANMDDLTEELEDIGMHTTMNDLEPLEEIESEDDIEPSASDTVAMQASEIGIDTSINTSIDTGISEPDPDATAAYSSSSLSADLGQEATEQFDASDIDTEFLDPAEQTVAQTHSDLEELGPPSLIEEVGTKLDLAKAFVDMGDSDAAKETLLEVINEGDESQIKAAKDLMDKLGS